MAGSAILSVKIVSDASHAAKGMDDAASAMGRVDGAARTASGHLDSASGGMRRYADSADEAAKKSRDISGGIESVGDTAGRATTGLRDMSDAVALAGFPQLAAGMGIAATGLESLDGAANLYKASQEAVTKGGKKLVGMLKATKVATVLTTTAQKAAALATRAFGVAMNFLKVAILTNPIFWIVAVLVGIAVAFVLLYKRCEGFRKVVDAVFKFAWNLIKTVWNWIKSAFAALLGILAKPFQLWLKVYTTILTTAWNVIKALFGWFTSTWMRVFNLLKAPIEKAGSWIKGAFSAWIGFLTGLVDKIRSVFAGVFDAIKKPFEKAIKWVKDHFKLPSLPSWLPGVGKAVPGMAGVFVPSPRAGGSTGRAGTPTVVINFNGPVGDPHAVTRQLRRMFREDEARLGRQRPSAVIA